MPTRPTVATIFNVMASRAILFAENVQAIFFSMMHILSATGLNTLTVCMLNIFYIKNVTIKTKRMFFTIKTKKNYIKTKSLLY